MQRLSASAAKAKAKRDLRYAKSADRKAKKAHSQREQRAAIKAGRSRGKRIRRSVVNDRAPNVREASSRLGSN